MAICSLKPNVTREAAIRQFKGAGVPGVVRTLRRGPLRAVADVYVPFWLFEVEIHNRSHRETRILGLDAVTASFDPYAFEAVPAGHAVVELHTRNYAERVVSENEARDKLVEQVRRMVFGSGFFRIRDLQISARALPANLYVPYWVGFFGRSELVNLTVIDAVRRCFEGAKVRDFVRNWLTS